MKETPAWAAVPVVDHLRLVQVHYQNVVEYAAVVEQKDLSETHSPLVER